MDRDALVPQRHPRYEEEAITIEEPKDKTKGKTKNSSQQRTPESRALYAKFCDKFEEIHEYKYAGNFFRDTANLQTFLKQKGIDFDTVSAMIEYVFDEKRGYWGSNIATVNTICYNQSSHTILDEVRKQKTIDDDPNWESKLGRL